MLVAEFDHDEIRRIATEDLHAARLSRQEIEEVKRRVFQSYETWTSKITGGGKRSEVDGGAGEFGWSKIEVPMVYWVVETEIPRIALGAPTLIASAMSPEAVRYQHAKTLRLQEQMRRAKARPAIFRSVKRMSLYGLGPMVWWWNALEKRVAVTDISWFDFWISPGARQWSDAECLWVRSWFTPRQARRMAKQKDAHGAPLYMNLEELADQPIHPETEDPTHGVLREAAGEGQQVFAEGGMVPLYTGYYDDGSIVMLGGQGYQTLVQARATPYWRKLPKSMRGGDDDGRRPYRPIVCLTNTPNTETPYPHGSGEVVLNYQEELSTFRRQAMDQATAHLNAPVIYDRAAVGEGASAKIDAAFGVPGGKLGVNGGTDVRSVVMRMSPGQLPFDVVNVSDMHRQESQLVTGISDYVAGQANMLGSNTTATAVQRITDEANMRWRFKNAIIEDDMQVAAMIVEAIDRQFGTEVFTNKGDDAPQNVDQGVDDHGGGLLGIGIEANGEDCEYDIKIEAGSLTPPSQSQEINDLMAMVNMLVVAPPMAQMVKWSEVAKEIVGRLGLEPDRVLMSDQEQMTAAVAANAAPGEEPVGPPIPVGAGSAGGAGGS